MVLWDAFMCMCWMGVMWFSAVVRATQYARANVSVLIGLRAALHVAAVARGVQDELFGCLLGGSGHLRPSQPQVRPPARIPAARRAAGPAGLRTAPTAVSTVEGGCRQVLLVRGLQHGPGQAGSARGDDVRVLQAFVRGWTNIMRGGTRRRF